MFSYLSVIGYVGGGGEYVSKSGGHSLLLGPWASWEDFL